MKRLAAESPELPEKENSRKYRRVYTGSFLMPLAVHLLSSAISGVLCLSDGLSDTENGLTAPACVFSALALALTLFFNAYTAVLRKKYKIETAAGAERGGWRYNCPVDLLMGILISFLFAFHSAIVGYTVKLLCA